jgi:hypothetical protein
MGQGWGDCSWSCPPKLSFLMKSFVQ